MRDDPLTQRAAAECLGVAERIARSVRSIARSAPSIARRVRIAASSLRCAAPSGRWSLAESLVPGEERVLDVAAHLAIDSWTGRATLSVVVAAPAVT